MIIPRSVAFVSEECAVGGYVEPEFNP